MQKPKNKYLKPKVSVKKIKVNFFAPGDRSFYSFGDWEGEGVYLAMWGCLLEGNRILVPDGKYVNIQNVQPGDHILSYDFTSRQLTENKIQKVIVNDQTEGYYIIINNKLKLTPNHRLWVNGTSWKRADDVKINDMLICSEGKKVLIHKLERIDAKFKTYNLRLDGKTHNYFAENILIHE